MKSRVSYFHCTSWIDHKLKSMQINLETYGVFIPHVESLSQTNSQAQKRSELKGYYQRWTDTSITVQMAIYLDVLSPLRRLSLRLQQDLHDQVKAVHRIQEFTQTMAKLKLLIDKSLDSSETLLTNYNKCLSDIEESNNDYFYAGIKLARFETIRTSVCNNYTQTVNNITSAMEERFGNLQISPIFKHLVSLLDVSTWPTDSTYFEKDRIQEIAKYFNETSIYNKCHMPHKKSQPRFNREKARFNRDEYNFNGTN